MPTSTSAPATTKGKGKSRAAPLDLTATAPDARPESTAEFERALLASPNSSFLWIQYMSFLLQLHEVDKARRIGRQALEKIGYREEEEKLNVWMALVNLELAKRVNCRYGEAGPCAAFHVFRPRGAFTRAFSVTDLD